MRPDVAGGGVGGLHGERPVRPVERKGQSLGLHRKAQQLLPRIGFAGPPDILPGDPVDEAHHPFPGLPGQLGLPGGEPMDEPQDRRFIAPGQLQPVRVFPGQVAPLEAFHQKGDRDRQRDRVDPVVVAMPVGLHDEFGIPDAQVGTETGGRFILGTIHPHPAALLRTGGQRDPAALGAAQIAAGEASVHPPVIEQVIRVKFPADVFRPRIGSQLVVVHGKGFVLFLVHEVDQPRRALAVHLERLRIDLPDHLAQLCPRPLYLLPIGRAVRILPMRIFRQDDDGADLLVPHDGAEPGPAGLLGPKKPLGSVHRLGRIEIVAVDATVGRPGGADARRQKNNLFFIMAFADKAIDDLPLHVEDVIDGGRIRHGDFPAETVNDDHDAPVGFSRDF